MTTPAPPVPHSVARAPRQGYVLALLALIASLGLVVMYWRNAQERELRAAQEEFAHEARHVAHELEQSLASYALAARGGASLFASVDRPSAAQWRDYARGLALDQRFPSTLGLGFAANLSRPQLQEHQLAVRDAGQGFFTVRPAGIRERYGPVTYLEPATPGNRGAIGFDMYADPTRREAMAAARDSGEPRLTAPVRLVQDQAAGQRGMLLYVPVYRNGLDPGDVASRREALRGWVFVPFDASRLLDGALTAKHEALAVRLADLDATPRDALGIAAPLSRVPVVPGSRQVLEHRLELMPFGRHWQLDFQLDGAVALARQGSALRATLVVGVLASLLLFGIALALARTESKARAMAARMSESFRRSELRFRAAMEYSAIGKGLLDRRGVLIDANPALVALLGIPRGRLLAQPFGALFVGGGDDAVRTGEVELVGAGVHRVTRQVRRPDGQVLDVQLTFAPVPLDVGEDLARLVQVEDVTERLRAQARIQAMNRSLETRVAARTRELTLVNQELESFAYSVSHDLRAPLRAIDGFSRLLKERFGAQLDDVGRDHLARIHNAATRMDELIGALLKMSRLSRVELKLAPLDLSQMAGELVAELRATQPEREVSVEIAPGLRATGDATLVRTLLQNLLGNAWKFTSATAQPRIAFGATPDAGFGDGAAGYFVRDNGAGFAAEYGDKLFRPFQRLHNQEEFAGHGIGLASVKRIVERHGGRIRGEGRVGEGACFWFTLPGLATAPAAD